MRKKIKILSPFGPRLGKLKLPIKIINLLNNEVDRIISNKKNLKKNDYSKKVVGQVYQEIKISKKFLKKKLNIFLKKEINNFLEKSINQTSKEIKFKSFWVVRQFSNEYNPLHYHDGDISGVGYLKIPNNLNKSKKKIKTNGTIDFVNGSRMLLNKSIFNHNPKVGDLIFFPNYLMHTAYPFSVRGERRSFSFNTTIDKKISQIING